MQRKLDVLGRAGLSKDNFSDADTTQLKVWVYQVVLSQHFVEHNDHLHSGTCVARPHFGSNDSGPK